MLFFFPGQRGWCWARAELTSKLYGISTAAIKANLLPAGPAFTAHARRTVKNLTFAEDEQLQLAEYLLSKAGSIEEEDENDKGLGEEIENRELLLCDPKAWKVGLSLFRLSILVTDSSHLILQSQDHYAVLGLQSLRYLATPDQIKKARSSFLAHAPAEDPSTDLPATSRPSQGVEASP